MRAFVIVYDRVFITLLALYHYAVNNNSICFIFRFEILVMIFVLVIVRIYVLIVVIVCVGIRIVPLLLGCTSDSFLFLLGIWLVSYGASSLVCFVNSVSLNCPAVIFLGATTFH